MIDTHCHLDMLKSKQDLIDSINSLDYLITIGCDKDEIPKAVELARKYENVYASVGFHPYDVNEIDDTDIENLKHIIKENKKIVAVGETGLDYYRDITPKDRQIYFFERHIQLSKEIGLPLIIHSRSAERDTEKILEKHAPYDVPGIIHCFGGDMKMMEACVDMGFYISFAGNVTYPKADNLRNILKKVPIDRLLLETDSPFLSPQKVRGKPNKPSNIYYTLEFVSDLLGIEKKQLEEILDQNAKKVFRLPQNKPVAV